jgi:putative sterol carrier protein
MTAQFKVQYVVSFSKKEEAIDGPDNADVVVRISAKDVDLDPTVAFMKGKLKAEGSTRALFEALWSGEAAKAISQLASHP